VLLVKNTIFNVEADFPLKDFKFSLSLFQKVKLQVNFELCKLHVGIRNDKQNKISQIITQEKKKKALGIDKRDCLTGKKVFSLQKRKLNFKKVLNI
jgi:hypothetical protein